MILCVAGDDMGREVFSEILYFDNYPNKEAFEKAVEIEFEKVKHAYPECMVTKEFYKVNNVLIRACIVERVKMTSKDELVKDREKDKYRGRER